MTTTKITTPATIDKIITQNVRIADELKSAQHTPSGKLSAGRLGKPLLEQVLSLIGVPTNPYSDYSLRKFARGNQVEAWFLEMFKPEQSQVEVIAGGVIGVIDCIKDSTIHEVKSIKNSQFPYINPENRTKRKNWKTGKLEPQYQGPQWEHMLQGGVYALALNQPEFWIDYITADDMRIVSHLITTVAIAPDIAKIVLEIDKQLKTGMLPVFKPRVEFHAKPEYGKVYSGYTEWLDLPPALAMTKLKGQFPDAYKKLDAAHGVGIDVAYWQKLLAGTPRNLP